MDKTGKLSIISIILIVSFGIFETINKYRDKNLKQEYRDVILHNKELLNTIEIQNKLNSDLKKNVQDQKQIIINSQLNSDKAIARLEKLEKIKEIAPTTSVSGVQQALSSLYNDKDASFNNGRFSIVDSTVYPLVTDAKEWRTNGPILKLNLSETTNALTLLKVTDNDKKTQLQHYEKLVIGFEKQDNLKNDLLIGKDKQINIVEKQLKVEHNNGIILSVKVGVSCALAAWAYEHFRKK